MKIYQKLNTIAKVLLATLYAASCFSNTNGVIDGFDDWVISDSCKQELNILCRGYYKPLVLPTPDTSSSKHPIKITADSASLTVKGTSIFKGSVVAIQGDKVIYADRANVVHDAETGDLENISAVGHVKIMQPGMRLDGSKATAYVKEHREVIENGVYRIYDKHARGTASSIIAKQNKIFILKDSTYTTCAPGRNDWYLKATTTELNRETGQGEAWNARLYAKDVPVFYFPYVNFPIDKRRQTGFLQPEIDSSSLNGFTVIVPYYLNLAPNYDATITTNYMSKRGFKFNNTIRYLTANGNGVINFDFLPQDRAYRALYNQLYANPQFVQATDVDTVVRRNDLRHSDFRYRIAAKTSAYLNPNWLLGIDFTDASDGNYLYDFQTDASRYATDKNSDIYALQSISLQNFNYLGVLRTKVERYQTFHVINGPSGTEQLTKLPAIDFVSSNLYLPMNLNLHGKASYINFRPNVIPGSNAPLTYGQRFNIRPELSYNLINPGWFFKPRVQINYVQYDHLQVVPADLAAGVSPGNTHLAIPMYDVKTGLIFERTSTFMHRNFLQTLEPTLYYLYVPVKNQNNLPNLDSGLLTFDYNQVFRDNRYTGGDYIGDANQLSIGLETKFFDPETGAERGMIGIGKIKYFRNKILLLDQELGNTQQSWSPYAIVGKLQIVPNYTLEANLAATESLVSTASLQLQYRPSPIQVVNFSYAYVRDTQPDDLTGTQNSNVNQVGVSAAWQVYAPLRLLGKVSYDLRFHRYLETLAGIEYHSCCTALRVLWSRTWMAEISSMHGHVNTFKLQVIFKGLAGVGTASARYVASLIPGYSVEH